MRDGILAAVGVVSVAIAAVLVVWLVRVPDMYAIEGRADVKYTPKEAEIVSSVYAENDVSLDAVKEVASTMRQILAALKAVGVAADDIKSADVRSGLLDESSSRNEGVKKPYFYAEQAVSIRVQDVAKIGNILDAIARAGSNYWLVQYKVSDADRRKLETQAREAAFLNAVATADAYADKGHFNRGRVLKIQDDDVQFPSVEYTDRSYRTHRSARTTRSGDIVEKVTVTGSRIRPPESTFDIPPPNDRIVSATTQVLFAIE